MYYCIRHNKLNSCKFLYNRRIGIDNIYDNFDVDYNKWMDPFNFYPNSQYFIDNNIDEKIFHQLCNHFKYVCCHGYLEIAQWLYNLNKICANSENINNIYIWVCQNGQLGVLKWIVYISNYLTNHDAAYDYACHYGHIHIMEYLRKIKYDNIEGPDDFHFYTFSGRHCSARFNNLRVLKWYYNLDKERFVTELSRHGHSFGTLIDTIINHAFGSGNIRIVKWLIKFSVHTNYLTFVNFKTACCKGQIYVAKWIYDKNKALLDTDTSAKEIFYAVLHGGNVNMAKWMLDLAKDKIKFDNNSFRIAYRHNLSVENIVMKTYILELMKMLKMPARFKL